MAFTDMGRVASRRICERQCTPERGRRGWAKSCNEAVVTVCLTWFYQSYLIQSRLLVARRGENASCFYGFGNYGAGHGHEPGEGGPRSQSVEPHRGQAGGRRRDSSHSGGSGAWGGGGLDVRFRYGRGGERAFWRRWRGA